MFSNAKARATWVREMLKFIENRWGNSNFLFFPILIVLLVSYAPYLLFNFGFHNDFAVWEYPNKSCCLGFIETPINPDRPGFTGIFAKYFFNEF